MPRKRFFVLRRVLRRPYLLRNTTQFSNNLLLFLLLLAENEIQK